MTQPKINYFETVAVPILQRKCQELFNAHMALETGLHMEVAQSRNLMEELAQVKSLQSSSASDVLALRDQLAESEAKAVKAENDFRNLQITINDKGNALSAAYTKINILEEELVASRKAIESLRQELENARVQLEETQKQFSSMSAAKPSLASVKNGKPTKVITPVDDF